MGLVGKKKPSHPYQPIVVVGPPANQPHFRIHFSPTTFCSSFLTNYLLSALIQILSTLVATVLVQFLLNNGRGEQQGLHFV